LGNGGRWIVRLEDAPANNGAVATGLDELWLALVMSLIGEEFTSVCGAGTVVGIGLVPRGPASRKNVALWMRAKDNRETGFTMAVGRHFREIVAAALSPLGNSAPILGDVIFEDFGRRAQSFKLPRSALRGQFKPTSSNDIRRASSNSFELWAT